MYQTDTLHFTVACVNRSTVSITDGVARKNNAQFIQIRKMLIERETAQNVKMKFNKGIPKYGKSEADLHQYSVVNHFRSASIALFFFCTSR